MKISPKLNFSKNCRGIISEYLPWMLIAIAILVVLMLTVFVLKGKGIEVIGKLKDIFRWR